MFELLLSLAILSFISVGLAGALNLAVRVYDRSGLTPVTQSEMALRIRLRNWLGTAKSLGSISSYPTELVFDDNQLAFTTLQGRGFDQSAAALRVVLSARDNELDVKITAMDTNGAHLDTNTFTLKGETEVRFIYSEISVDSRTRHPAAVQIAGFEGLVFAIGY